MENLTITTEPKRLTVSQIKALAEAKNHTIIENFDLIGIRLRKQHTYHWFNIREDNTIKFSHSYSQNTGSTHKGFRHGLTFTKNLINQYNKLTKIS